MEHASAARIPTMWGPFTAHCYRSILDGIEHIAMVKVINMQYFDVIIYKLISSSFFTIRFPKSHSIIISTGRNR